MANDLMGTLHKFGLSAASIHIHRSDSIYKKALFHHYRAISETAFLLSLLILLLILSSRMGF
jgi:hypothetical protein